MQLDVSIFSFMVCAFSHVVSEIVIPSVVGKIMGSPPSPRLTML